MRDMLHADATALAKRGLLEEASVAKLRSGLGYKNLAFDALGFSPVFAATTLAASLFSYQLGRLAWFFVYIDVRVRRDCWDMELLLARESKRLEGE